MQKPSAEYENFKASLVELITIAIATIITFFLTEMLNRKRRLYDCIEHILLEIEQMVQDDKIFYNDDSRVVFMLQRLCANKIRVLQETDIKQFESEFKAMGKDFECIRDLYSNHYHQGVEVLRSLETDFCKFQTNIIERCDEVRMKLYTN